MLFLNEKSETILLDSLYSPIVSTHMWVLDLTLMDYTLAPIQILEEVTSSSVVLNVRGFSFVLPSNWYVLIYDQETMQLDVVQASDLAGSEFTAFVYGPNKSKPESAVIRVVDYLPQYQNVGPLLNKHQMLCHPIDPTSWITIAPSDVFNKFLKNAVVGDII